MHSFPLVSIVHCIIGTAALFLLVPSPAAAQTQIDWSGTTDTTWATGTNWVGGVAPANDLTSNIARFNSAFTTSPNAGISSIAGIEIGTGRTLFFTLTTGTTGGGLSIGASGINLASTTGFSFTLGNLTDNQITIAAAQTWNFTSSASRIDVYGSLAINNLLTITGAGQVRLYNASTGGGGITTGLGILYLGNATTLGTGTFTISGGSLDAGNIVISTNNTQVWNGNFSYIGFGSLNLGTGAVNLGAAAGPRTIGSSMATTLTVGGVISDGSGTNSLAKTGIGTLTLMGANAYTGTTAASGGNLIFGGTASIGGTGRSVTVTSPGAVTLQGAADITPLANRLVLSSTGTIALDTNSGVSYNFALSGFTALGLGAIGTVYYTGTVTPAGGNFRLGVSSGTLVYASNYTGTSLTVNGNVTLLGASNYTGVSTLNPGILSVPTLANGGSNSSIGSSSNAAANLIFNNGTLQYTGPPQTIDRNFTLTAGTSSSISVLDSLTITGASTATTGSILKSGRGTLTLSGANLYTGVTIVGGGKLVLDYSAGNNAITQTSVVRIDSGSLVFRAPATGTFARTINSINLGGVTAGSLGSLILDNNGNSNGVKLTIGALYANPPTPTASLIDLSSSANNSITATLIGTTVLANGVITTGSPARATYIARTSAGYGFATSTSNTAGTIGRLVPSTVVNGGAAFGSNQNLLLNSNVTRTSDLNFNTLTIDASAADIALGFNSGTIINANSSSVLVFGGNNVTITGSVGITTPTLWHHYGTGILSISQNFLSGAQIFFAGTGFIAHSGTIGVNATGLNISGTVFRTIAVQSLNSNTGTLFSVASGGVFEIGADLNGALAGDFSNAIGTSASNFRFVNDSGVSAFGGTRIVNFGGASATLTWGSGAFLTNPDNTTDGGYAFKLSSARSDSTVIVQNPIDLGGRPRVFDVANGSAATDARLTGVLSGNGASVVKNGAGTLEFTALNAYLGTTTVNAGTLLINGNQTAVTGTITVGGVAATGTPTLGGNGTLGGNLTVSSTTTVGTVAPGSNGVGTLTVLGNTTLAGKYAFELSATGTPFGSAPTNGASSPTANHDVLTIFGNSDITGFTVAPTSLGATGFLSDQYYSWKILTSIGTLAGTPNAVLDAPAGSDFNSLAGGSFSLAQDSNNLYLNYAPAAVPEPGTILGIAAMGLGWRTYVRRRRARG